MSHLPKSGVFNCVSLIVDETRNIAKRYLFSKKRVSLISVLTLISIAGVTVGTALLIIILSVFNGFFDVIQSLLRTYDPDIRIQSSTSPAFSADSSWLAGFEDIEQIVGLTRYVEGKGLIAYEGTRDKVVIVKGIETKSYFPLVEQERAGNMVIPRLSVVDRQPGILIGNDLRSQLNVVPGDRIALLSPEGMRRSLTQFSGPRFYSFQVRGMYQLASVYDGSIVFVEIEAAQRLFNLRNAVTGVDIRLQSPDQADAVKSKIEQIIGPEYEVKTWYDLQKPLYDIMYIEKWAAYVILSLIIAVAVLNILGSLTMIVIQKQRDIGILMSMGFTPRHIRSIFMYQGFFIGLIGSLVGGAIGFVVCYLQDAYGIVKLSGSAAFLIDAYPVLMSWTDIAAVLLVTMSLCLLAALYPAKRAAMVEPSAAIRYE
jgi:lipoprotein-releasing system permease protein